MPASMMIDTATKKTGDRHKPSRMVRIPEAMATAMERIAGERMNTLTAQVKEAIREYLVRMKYWPPKRRGKDSSA